MSKNTIWTIVVVAVVLYFARTAVGFYIFEQNAQQMEQEYQQSKQQAREEYEQRVAEGQKWYEEQTREMKEQGSQLKEEVERQMLLNQQEMQMRGF